MAARLTDSAGEPTRLVWARVSRITAGGEVLADFGDELEEEITWPAHLPAAQEGDRALVALGVITDRTEPPPAIAVR